ncbi:MAG: hypothetical protein KGY99_08670, partial [Phycisphaerae bacterium]|nr:hypothetical protein [Phycisphaerae bacterium]
MVKIATCRQTGLGTGWCDALRVALVMVTFVVFVLLAGGCGRPWRYRGSKIQRTLAKVQDDEVIELTYIWKHLLSRPPSEFRDDTRYARFRGSDRQGLVHWPDRTDDDDPTYHVCVDVTRPPAVGQMTELHRRLVEAGFAPIGAPGAPWRRTWTYRAPAGVRE